jgi:hypothetical protein
MRPIVGIAVLVCGLGGLSCAVKFTLAESEEATAKAWVRTVDGWEHADNWNPSIAEPPRLHPLVIAAGQVFTSAFALALFASNPPRR